MRPQLTEFDYQPLPQPIRITEQEWQMNTRPLLSIVCATYNHVDFIQDCIEGFLKQETTFPVEILIHDDASTDGATDIIRDYQQKYPRLIKTVLQEKNQYSRGVKVLRTFIHPLVQGKYIASCEGDDYWVDPRKLEIQVRFLEDNPEYVVSGHDAMIVDDQRKILKASKLPSTHKRDYTGTEIMKGKAWILTMSRVKRVSASKDFVPESMHVLNGDTFSTAILGRFGASKYHAEIQPAVYRKHQGGVWSMLSATDKQEAKANTMYWLYRFFKRIEQKEIARTWRIRWLVQTIKISPTFLLYREIILRLTGARWIMRKIRGVSKQ